MKYGSACSSFLTALFLVVTLIVNAPAHAQSSGSSGGKTGDGGPSVEKPFAEATLVTNWVDRGVSQSDNGLALQTGFGYQWAQFRLGLWGSNVKYWNSDDNLNLRLYGNYRFIITPNADLNVKYALNRYFKSGSRDGSVPEVDLQMFTYHVTYESIENWEASGVASIRYGFGKEFNFYWGTTIEANIGYSDMAGTGFSNSADARATWKYKAAGIVFGLTLAAQSAATEYGSHGGPFIIGSVGTNF